MLNAITTSKLSLIPAPDKPAEIVPMKSTKANIPNYIAITLLAEGVYQGAWGAEGACGRL